MTEAIDTSSVVDLDTKRENDKPFWDQIEKWDISDAVKIKGHKTIEIRQRSKSGEISTANFKEDYSRSESLDLNMTGHANGVTVDVQINQSSQALSEQNKQRIFVEHNNFSLLFGEFQSDFVNQNLLKFQDQMDGVKGDITFPNHAGGFVLSTPKGERQKETIQGNNSQGPFIVNFRPVVPNTEEVYIEHQRQQKDIDYKIDYITGKITFLSTIISQDDEITVTYETENSSFSNQVTGYKYQYFGFPDARSDLYFIQKKSTDKLFSEQIGSSQTEILLLTQQYKTGPISLFGELGISKFIPDATLPDQRIGPAGHLELAYGAVSGNVLNMNTYITKISSQFQPLNSYDIHPNDLKYGIASDYQLDSASTIKVAYTFQKEYPTSVSAQEESFQIGAGTKVLESPVAVDYTRKTYIENEAKTPTDSQWTRDTYLLSGRTQNQIGKWTASARFEDKDDSVNADQSYYKKTFQGGYSVEPMDAVNVAIDGTVNLRDSLGTTESDGRIKLSSAVSGIKNYSVSGFYEYLRFSSKPDSSIINLDSELRPIDPVQVSLRTERESLRETILTTEVDTEQNDSTIKLQIEPIKRVKLKATYLLKSKQTKPNFIVLSDRQNSSYQISTPIYKATTSYLYKRDRRYNRQLTYYPDHLFKDGIVSNDTHIVRLRTPIGRLTQAAIQYEKDFSHLEDLSATSDAQYDVTHTEKEIKEIELTHKLKDWTLGLGYQNTYEIQTIPSQDIRTEDRYSLFGKTIWLRTITVKPKLSILKTQADGLDYMSIEPELNIACPLWEVARLNFIYQYRHEFKSQPETLHTFDTALKSDVGENLILSLDLKNQFHTNPSYNTHELGVKGSLVF